MKPNQIAKERISEAIEKNSKVLDLSGLGIKSIPKEIGRCTSVIILRAWKNNLTSLPKEIGNLKKLESLFLAGNKITNLPKEIGELTNLKELYLTSNQIEVFPIELTYLKRLQKLILYRNNIVELPFEFGNLAVSELDLKNNPIVKPPLEIVSRGMNSIRNYFSSIEGSELFQLKEAKILIVGDGGVGKSCLMEKLLDPTYVLNKTEESTEGIAIKKWGLSCGKDTEVKVNFWDFGGQEIYHSTHQFFLTKRSIYIYVWNARTDDDLSSRFEYWLNTIKLLSDNSPLILVQNKVDERMKFIDILELRKIYPNIVGSINTSVETGAGIDKLVNIIKSQLIQLPHLGDVLPKAWLEIRKIIEDLNQDYIHLDDYLAICKEFDIEEEKAHFLGRYFHDLGVFLHFASNPILQSTLFLRPEWATNAVYKIIDTKEVQINRGRFSYEELYTIWTEYPEEKFVHLIELMKMFELCFQVRDAPEFIVPNMLPAAKPKYSWKTSQNLRYEYQYSFMPSGIMSRFIVRIAPIIYHDRYWRNGVMIQKEGCFAEITSDKFRKRIRIKLQGSNKKDLLAIIRHELNLIHRSLNNPPLKELIPCVCKECRKSKDPAFHSYQKLDAAIQKRKKTVECPISFEAVDIKLLFGSVEKSKETELQRTIINYGNYYEKTDDMEIENLNIYGGNQQFADTIINNSKNSLDNTDREILKLIHDNVDTPEGRAELVEALSDFKNETTEPEKKSKAKSLLEQFLSSGAGEAGKQVAKELAENGGEYLQGLF